MTVPLRIGLELVSLAAYGGLAFKPSRHPGYRGAVHVPASLRVGAAMAAGLLIAASTPVAPPSTAAPANIAGMIVFLDPGHNGANDASISRQVPTGRGGTKDCQASGSATNDGYPEHTFAWDTTLRIRAALTALGVRTAMSRGDDTGLGPCVDERAAMANAFRPNADRQHPRRRRPTDGTRFPRPLLVAAAQRRPGRSRRAVRAGHARPAAGSGIPPSNYIGSGGLNPRADIAGLNLAQFPSILVELGNMKNPADSALITSPEGRQKYADAVVRGIAAFLGTQAR